MSNRSKVLVAVFIIAGIAGLIVFDLALSAPSASAAPVPTGPAEQRIVEELTPIGETVIPIVQDPAPIASGPAIPEVAVQPESPGHEEPGKIQKGVETRVETLPAAPRKHIVRAGESWWTVAEKYYGGRGYLYKVIEAENPDLQNKFLPVGKEILIPPAPESPSKGRLETAGATGADVYTVKAGDSLEKISVAVYGSPRFVSEIVAANKDAIRDPSKLRIGTQLLLPKPGSMAPVIPDQATVPILGARVHEVQQGESLWVIAQKYAPGSAEKMIDKIVKANGDKLRSKDAHLRMGWKLAIPE